MNERRAVYDDEELADTAHERGAVSTPGRERARPRHLHDSYIRTPIDFDELFPVLEQLVRSWRALNQPPPPEMQP